MNSAKSRFWDKVDQIPCGGCWLWSSSLLPQGYGLFWLDGKTERAHRLALTWEKGPPEQPDLQALHSCDNPPCVNPAHLRWGTSSENARDTRDRGRAVIPDNRGENHGMSKLSEGDIFEIRFEHSHGALQKDLATRYGVARSCISKVVNRKAWKHLGEVGGNA